jgi:C1A family cysteine protease
MGRHESRACNVRGEDLKNFESGLLVWKRIKVKRSAQVSFHCVRASDTMPPTSSKLSARSFQHKRDPRAHTRFFEARAASRRAQGRPEFGDGSHFHRLRDAPLPSSCNLLTALGVSLSVFDQGAFSSCTANATCFAAQVLHYAAWRAAGFVPSRFYQYNMTRMLGLQSLSADEGAYIFDACSAMERARCASETAFPYTLASSTAPPQLPALTSAAQAPWAGGFDFVLLCSNSPTEAELLLLKAALAANQPIVFGFEVFSQSMDAADASPYMLRLPSSGDTNLGGHCVCLVGYDDARATGESARGGRGAFRLRNSWGSTWADGGDCWVSAAFLMNHGFDFYALASSSS